MTAIIAFADDMVLNADSQEKLQTNLQTYKVQVKQVNMEVNVQKTTTKVIANSEKQVSRKLQLTRHDRWKKWKNG